ncbi:hypothetical protein [Lysobacter tyrosinilyticus]
MNHKNLVLAILAIASFASGAIDQYFYPGRPFPPTAVAFTLIGVALIFFWYRLDSTQLGYRRSPWLNVSVIALAIVALPYYFFRSRGFKKGAIATGVMLLAYAASSALTLAGSYSAYYGLQG